MEKHGMIEDGVTPNYGDDRRDPHQNEAGQLAKQAAELAKDEVTPFKIVKDGDK